MQTEEVINTSRLYSILLTERPTDVQEEHDLLAHWSGGALLSEIKHVKRTLSRKLSTIRRGRRKADQSHDISSDKSAIKLRTCQKLAKLSPLSRSDKRSQTSSESPTTTCYPDLSSLVGTFTRTLRHDRPKQDQTEELTSGRDSAYFSLNQTSSESEAEGQACDETLETVESLPVSRTPSALTTSLLRTSSSAVKTEPKKNVTLLLPKTKTKQKPFGIHLQTEVVAIQQPEHEIRLNPDGDVAWQLESIVQVSKVHLVSNFPRYGVSIEIIFSQPPQAILMSLSSDVIGDLMFHLNRILFSPHLKTIVTWEVTLFLIIKFLYKLVAMINSNRLCKPTLNLSCVKNFQNCLLKEFCNFKTAEILTQIQREFIQIWMSLIL